MISAPLRCTQTITVAALDGWAVAVNDCNGCSESVLLFEKVFPVGTEVESWLGGLVVAYVLSGGAEAVGDVLHQAVDAVVGGDGADEDAQFGTVLGACHHLLAPVAQDVGGKAGVGLGAVVEADVGELDDVDYLLLLLVTILLLISQAALDQVESGFQRVRLVRAVAYDLDFRAAFHAGGDQEQEAFGIVYIPIVQDLHIAGKGRHGQCLQIPRHVCRHQQRSALRRAGHRR